MHAELNNIIVCLMISQKNYLQTLHKQASMSYWILGRFEFSQNEFKMRRNFFLNETEKKSN